MLPSLAPLRALRLLCDASPKVRAETVLVMAGNLDGGFIPEGFMFSNCDMDRSIVKRAGVLAKCEVGGVIGDP